MNTAAGGTLSEADLDRLIDAFARSGTRALDLRCGCTRIRLGAPQATVLSVEPVTAPRVGAFHPAGGVKPGTSVSEGMALGRICGVSRETQFFAPRAGVIAAQVLDSGAFAEYGQTLFEIVPAPAGEGGAG